MNANELRIGNWVHGPLYEVAQVTQLGHKDNPNYIEAKGNGFIAQNGFEPIPLSEEWLLKFGFENPAYSWCGEIFHLSEWDAYPLNWCVAMNRNGAVIVERLEHVHQLQNLYFALTGKELTITHDLLPIIPPHKERISNLLV